MRLNIVSRCMLLMFGRYLKGESTADMIEVE